jgi:hypothetical protein
MHGFVSNAFFALSGDELRATTTGIALAIKRHEHVTASNKYFKSDLDG